MNKSMIAGIAFSVAFAAAPAFASSSTRPGDSWQIDTSHSTAGFAVRHMMASNVRGRLGAVQGHAVYDGKDLAGASVTATVDLAGIDTHDAQRDADLRSDQFFDTKKYPTVTFKSTKFEKTDDGFNLYGDLTMHGVTRQVVLKGEKPTAIVKDPWGFYRFGVSARTKINRKDFGINYNKLLDNGGAIVADDVAVELDIEASQKSL